MRISTTLTQFIQELSVIIDKGGRNSFQEVYAEIANNTLVDWLEQTYPIETYGADFTMFKKKHRDYLNNHMASIMGARSGQERRKWGITENGLCLLISWTTEAIREEFNKDDFIPKTE
ncbi:hypothetical protein [Paenibacillus sp. NPDC057934]|uniref:hypothetical protein n=1 Tax=Paenibacillus sp. NPDC057934 TaxID=3346282 RepID=UPI0036DAFF65